jgi:hypothetical protein
MKVDVKWWRQIPPIALILFCQTTQCAPDDTPKDSPKDSPKDTLEDALEEDTLEDTRGGTPEEPLEGTPKDTL